MTRYQVCIKGSNVQRCGFRNFASQLARELGLYGQSLYIDNLIQIEVEGIEDSLKKFIAWCKTGPAYCQIEEVIINELPLAGYKSFKVIPGVISSEKS
jgi:acylphosphatase